MACFPQFPQRRRGRFHAPNVFHRSRTHSAGRAAFYEKCPYVPPPKLGGKFLRFQPAGGIITRQVIDNAGKRVSVATSGLNDSPEQFFVSFFQYAPALKHPSFSEENEWRIVSEIVQPTDPATKFRPGRSMLRPYREFSLEEIDHRVPVSKIFVGPRPHPDQSVFSVTGLLFSHGITDCAVVDSKVPYRTW